MVPPALFTKRKLTSILFQRTKQESMCVCCRIGNNQNTMGLQCSFTFPSKTKTKNGTLILKTTGNPLQLPCRDLRVERQHPRPVGQRHDLRDLREALACELVGVEGRPKRGAPDMRTWRDSPVDFPPLTPELLEEIALNWPNQPGLENLQAQLTQVSKLPPTWQTFTWPAQSRRS